MKKNPRLLAIVGLTAATLVLTGCTGGTDPLANNTLKGGTTPVASASPEVTPTPAPSLAPVSEEETTLENGKLPEVNDGGNYDYRKGDYVLGYKITDLKPAPAQVEAYPKEYVDTVLADTLYFLQLSKSFNDFHHKEMSDLDKELVLSDYADLTTPNGIKNLKDAIDGSAFYLIPHRTPLLTDEDGKELKWDSTREWKIAYSDLKFMRLEDKENAEDPQSVYSIVQEIQVPVEGGKIAIMKNRLYLFMEYGADSWLLDNWKHEFISSGWAEQ